MISNDVSELATMHLKKRLNFLSLSEGYIRIVWPV